MISVLLRERWKQQIRHYARERLGFLACGFARVKPLEQEARHLEKWLKEGAHATMEYMERTFDIRVDVRRIFPDARTAICVLDSYWTGTNARLHPEGPAIARYAHGKDYHHVLGKKLQQLLLAIQSFIGEWVEGWYSVDSRPVLERAWAQRAGLGWIGKNTMLLRRNGGSWTFIGVLFVNVDLEPDVPWTRDYCGTCRRCMDACPTGALQPHFLDARKCISYWTIEYRGKTFPSSAPHWKDYLFGCDICQEVCPWNRFAVVTPEPAYEPLPVLKSWTWEDWKHIRRGHFRRELRYSPLRRAGVRGIRRNLQKLLSTSMEHEEVGEGFSR